MDPFQDQNPFETFHFEFKVADGDTVDVTPVPIELRGYKTDSDQVWKSTGLTIWKAAEVLGRYMAQHYPVIQNQSVMELGAGLGLCGILAHRLGAAKTCITDGDSDALQLLKENLERNKSDDTTCMVSVHQLIWGKDTAQKFSKRHGTLQVLIASDIIYARCIVEPLWETVQTLLERTMSSKFIMAYFSKRKVNVTIDVVLEHAQEAGFEFELVEEDPEGVHIYVFQWKLADELSN
jgi:predicted nicotinamide N-methyase